MTAWGQGPALGPVKPWSVWVDQSYDATMFKAKSNQNPCAYFLRYRILIPYCNISVTKILTQTCSQGSIQSASLILSKVSNNMASSVHSSSAGIWDVNQLILQVTETSNYNIIIGQWSLEYLSCWPWTVHRFLISYININNKTCVLGILKTW